MTTEVAPESTLDDVVVDAAVRQIIRRFAPSAYRVRDLERHRRSFTEMRPCKERRLVAKLYTDLGLSPLDFGGVELAGAIYARATFDSARSALVSVHAEHGLSITRAKRFKTASSGLRAAPATWQPDAFLILEPDAGDWICIASREWELVDPTENALAAALSRHFPVLALVKGDGERAIALHDKGSCTSDRIVDSDGVTVASDANVTDALIERVFGAPAPAPVATLTPFDFDDAGFAQTIEGILDAHMDDDRGEPIPELLVFGVRRGKTS